MTASEYFAALQAARIIDGDADPKDERNDALGDYFRARDEVRERARAEVTARSSEGKGGSA